jgi:cytochrome P450
MAEYFHSIIEERRREPREDLLSLLIAAEERGEVLSEEELIATCILLLAAGNETTTNLIGNGTLALFQNPEQHELLRKDRSLVEPAVEEMLRFTGPVQATARVALEEIDVGGQQIDEGQLALCLLAAANRDPAVFDDPEDFDIRRRENRHVAFGFGIHFCLGAPLARAEAQIAFDALLERMPDLRLESEDYEWNGNFILRGLKRLPIAW